MITGDGKSAKSRVNTTVRDRTLPEPGTLQKMQGYGTLTIYKMDASPYWYARFYEGGKIDRFYAKHLTAEMNIEALQSLKKKKRTDAASGSAAKKGKRG